MTDRSIGTWTVGAWTPGLICFPYMGRPEGLNSCADSFSHLGPIHFGGPRGYMQSLQVRPFLCSFPSLVGHLLIAISCWQLHPVPSDRSWQGSTPMSPRPAPSCLCSPPRLSLSTLTCSRTSASLIGPPVSPLFIFVKLPGPCCTLLAACPAD